MDDSKADENYTFPLFVKFLVFGSVVPIVLSLFISILYYFVAKFLLIPSLVLLLTGLLMFAAGMSAASYYDKRGN
jgi:hypothetical protein